MRRCARAHSVLLAVRETTPLISCITNSVAAGFTADVLLAGGAAPAMVDITGEAGTFAAAASGRAVAILVDLQGPKIRLGRFVDDQKVMLNKGDEFTITIDDVLGTVKRASPTFKRLPGHSRLRHTIDCVRQLLCLRFAD